MSSVQKVLIVGGGIAGLALSVSLHQKGIQAEIVERQTDGTVLGVGILQMAPALRALKALGLLDSCLEKGFPFDAMLIGDAEGRVLARIPQPRLAGDEYPANMGIMRPPLHTVLIEGSRQAGTRMRLGMSVVNLNQDAKAVEVEFTDGTRDTYDLVVGADGIYSQVRKLLYGEQFKPRYVGQAVWRANLERPPEVVEVSMWYGPSNKAGFCPLSQGEMYLFLTENVPTMSRPAQEQLPALLREQLAAYKGLVGEVRERITDPQQINYRPIESVLLPPPWYQGRILLIGDAAHATSPHLASGAGMALEDAVVLAEELASDVPISQALEQFMSRRYERCRLVVENSLQLVEWEKNPTAPDADFNGLTDQSFIKLAEPY